jgi:tripartite-type tricarboxylate transporter receptor subunit TctC
MGELQAGRIDFLCEVSSTAKPHIDGGTVRALAIFNDTRSPALPNLPTAKEQGTEGLIAYTWNAIFLPKGAPADVVEKLNKAAVDAIGTPAVKEKLAGLGAEIATGQQTTPAYLAKLVKDETEKWAVPIKASGVTVD